MINRNDKGFQSHLNPTNEIIHVNNQQVNVRIFRHNNSMFELRFNHKENNFTCNLGPIYNKEYHVNSEDISFEGITLNAIDKNKLANDINQIIDFLYD